MQSHCNMPNARLPRLPPCISMSTRANPFQCWLASPTPSGPDVDPGPLNITMLATPKALQSTHPPCPPPAPAPSFCPITMLTSPPYPAHPRSPLRRSSHYNVSDITCITILPPTHAPPFHITMLMSVNTLQLSPAHPCSLPLCVTILHH